MHIVMVNNRSMLNPIIDKRRSSFYIKVLEDVTMQTAIKNYRIIQ